MFRRSRKELHLSSAEVVSVRLSARGMRETGRREPEHELELLVSVPGAAQATVRHVCRIPWDRVPAIGQRLRVSVDPGDPSRLSIAWEDMPSNLDRARSAEQAARAGDAEGVAKALGFRLRD